MDRNSVTLSVLRLNHERAYLLPGGWCGPVPLTRPLLRVFFASNVVFRFSVSCTEIELHAVDGLEHTPHRACSNLIRAQYKSCHCMGNAVVALRCIHRGNQEWSFPLSHKVIREDLLQNCIFCCLTLLIVYLLRYHPILSCKIEHAGSKNEFVVEVVVCFHKEDCS